MNEQADLFDWVDFFKSKLSLREAEVHCSSKQGFSALRKHFFLHSIEFAS